MNSPICRSCGCESVMQDTGILGNGGVQLAQCSVCHSVLVMERVTREELELTYDKLFKRGNYGGLNRNLERARAGKSIRNPIWLILIILLERLSPGRRMAELGGGVGLWGYYATKRAWSYVNYDISAEAVDTARSIGLNSYHFEIDTLPPLEPNSLDCIVMLDVIEHVWNVGEYLRLCYDALNVGGTLLIVTPNFLKEGYREAISKPGLGSPPIHLNFFTAESISETIRKAGFERVFRIQRRIYRGKSFVKSAKIALGIEPEPNLYLIARKLSTVADY